MDIMALILCDWPCIRLGRYHLHHIVVPYKNRLCSFNLNLHTTGTSILDSIHHLDHMDTLVKRRVWAALVGLCLTAAVAPECDCFFPYGTDWDHLEYKARISGNPIDLWPHNQWNETNIGEYMDFPESGYIEFRRKYIQILYWKGAGINMYANPHHHIFLKMETNATLLTRAKNDVVSAFGDTTFNPYQIAMHTIANFTYVGGDSSSKMNTIQILLFTDRPGTKVYIQINVDIEWWNATGFPVLGISKQQPRGNNNESIAYHIPGSGTPRIQSVLSAGNTGVSGRWMFTPTCTLCATPYALGIPNGYLSIGSISEIGESQYTSFCHPGYTGQMCETRSDYCASSPCVYGNCTNVGSDSYNCTCEAGYTGCNCEININDCTDNPCANGCCQDLVNNYTCVCHPGWTGTDCGTNIDDCQTNPCFNGTCVDLINGYNCTCNEGFSGSHCETNIGVYGRFCENDTRPSPGNYSEWSGYGACTKTCDSGLQKRTRQCLRESCDGCTYEYRLCNVNRCEEVDSEITFSLLISTSKGLLEVVEEEHELKKDVAQSMNSYCSSNSVECCEAGGMSVVSNIVISAFAEDDVVLVKGYPSEANSNTVHIRFFVRLSQSFVSACTSQAGNNNLVRKKRQTSSTLRTIPVAIVRKAVGGTIGQVQEGLCCYNVVTNTIEISTFVWGAILGVSVTLTLMILILFFVVFMPWCQCKRSALSKESNNNIFVRYNPSYKRNSAIY